MAGSCECCNEPSSFIKCGEFPDLGSLGFSGRTWSSLVSYQSGYTASQIRRQCHCHWCEIVTSHVTKVCRDVRPNLCGESDRWFASEGWRQLQNACQGVWYPGAN